MAIDRAKRHGYGVVQVSARRYVVVRFIGAGAIISGPSTTPDGAWRGHVSYRTLTRPVGMRVALAAVSELDRAAEEGGVSALSDAYYRLATGDYRPDWR